VAAKPSASYSRTGPGGLADGSGPPPPTLRRLHPAVTTAPRLSVVIPSQCGFKLFTERASIALFGALETAGFAFDVELLLRAQARGYRVVEVPVNWADQQGSKVGVVFNGPGMLLQLLRARWRVGWR
jgi:hypothetical protein